MHDWGSRGPTVTPKWFILEGEKVVKRGDLVSLSAPVSISLSVWVIAYLLFEGIDYLLQVFCEHIALSNNRSCIHEFVLVCQFTVDASAESALW